MKRCIICLVATALACQVFGQSSNTLQNARPEDIDLKPIDDVVVKPGKADAAVRSGGQQVKSYSRHDGTLWLMTTGGTLCLRPTASGALHVMYGDEAKIKAYRSYMVDYAPVPSSSEMGRGTLTESSFAAWDDSLSLTFNGLTVTVNMSDSHITLYDGKGKNLVSEWPGRARANVEGDSVCAYICFKLHDGEAIYGLGEYRDGCLNLRDKRRELVQFNTQAAVPVVHSTRGWGLLWDNVSRTVFSDTKDGMTLRSDYGDVVSYYLMAGPTLDSLVRQYRQLTGHQPMLPKWALGFHQSRNRYHNWKELYDVAERMKNENIPMSSIFIDYHYWGKYGTGSMRFDEATFPNPAKMIDSLCNTYNTHVVITMWPCFKPGTDNYNLMSSKGFILEGARAIDGYIYDVFNPAARAEYRRLIKPLLDLPVDGWFIDGPEPDHIQSFLPAQTYLGSAHRVRNLYPLLHSENFYRAVTEARPGERPYMLTRCALAGQQRYGTAVWSGDIPTTFDELRKQVVAGLSFTATGIPYWTTDIGGYSGGDPKSDAYRELFVRWFEWGTFCPIFRSHGRRVPFDTTGENELWSYGDRVEGICKDFINLRYRLMPYIYSLSGAVTQRDYTPMRLLAFDFPTDSRVLDCKDEFMYGPAFLVCPVVEAGTASRQVYLPQGCQWIDYWTGKVYEPGTTLIADAPLERMPLYVRAGSIIPTTEAIDIYGGADGLFELYEDDGHTMDYEKGDFTLIPMVWDDVSRTLTIGRSNVRAKRKMTVRLVGLGKTKKVSYKGKAVTVKF